MTSADDEPKCGAELHIADDFSDNHATIKCEDEAGHVGAHWTEFTRGGKPVYIEWGVDERETS